MAIGRMADTLHPERIILFGSYAYGAPTPGSDVDLLIVMDTDIPRRKRASAVYGLLDRLPFHPDIWVRTPAEIDHALAIGDFFIREIVTQGQVVYEHGRICPVDPHKQRALLDLSFPVGGEMNEVTDPLAWVARAEDDYEASRWAFRRRRPSTNLACFHAQQCIEKYMKAALVARGQGFPKVHSLSELNDLATPLGILVPLTPRQMEDLGKYAVEVRYPGEGPTLEDAREALELARGVRRYVRRLIGLR